MFFAIKVLGFFVCLSGAWVVFLWLYDILTSEDPEEPKQ